MFNKHLFKVIAGFCGMILLGLLSLMFIDSMKSKQAPAIQEKASAPTTLPPVKTLPPPASSPHKK